MFQSHWISVLFSQAHTKHKFILLNQCFALPGTHRIVSKPNESVFCIPRHTHNTCSLCYISVLLSQAHTEQLQSKMNKCFVCDWLCKTLIQLALRQFCVCLAKQNIDLYQRMVVSEKLYNYSETTILWCKSVFCLARHTQNCLKAKWINVLLSQAHTKHVFIFLHQCFV